jgi:MFS family permease
LIARSRLTIAATLSLASFAASINLLFAALVKMGAEFGIRPEILASVSSIYFACFFVASLIGGTLTDRYSARMVLMAGCAFTAGGGLMFSVGSGLAAVVEGVVLMGMGGGIIEPMCSALLNRLFPDRVRTALNLSQAGYCLGAIGGPLLMSLLLPTSLSWRTFFFPVALMAVANFGLFAWSAFGPAPAPPAQQAAAEMTGWTLITRWSVLQPCIVVLLYVLAESSVSGFLNIYLFEFRNAPEQIAIQSIALFWGVMLVGRTLAGFLPARLPDRLFIAVSMTLAGLVVAVSALTHSWPAALFCFVMASFIMAGSWPATVALAAARNPVNTNTVIGMTVAAGSIGCILSPLIMGHLIGSLNPGVAMSLAAFPLSFGALTIVLGPRTSVQEFKTGTTPKKQD